jgi:hypothetical protein
MRSACRELGQREKQSLPASYKALLVAPTLQKMEPDGKMTMGEKNQPVCACCGPANLTLPAVRLPRCTQQIAARRTSQSLWSASRAGAPSSANVAVVVCSVVVLVTLRANQARDRCNFQWLPRTSKTGGCREEKMAGGTKKKSETNAMKRCPSAAQTKRPDSFSFRLLAARNPEVQGGEASGAVNDFGAGAGR